MSEPRRKPLTADMLGIQDVEQTVSEIYVMDIARRNGDELFFVCPSHDDHNPSASINRRTGWWHCWSCGAGGDIISLGAAVLKRPRTAVSDLLTPSDPQAVRLAIIRTLEAKAKPQRHGRHDVEVADRTPEPDEYADGPMNYMYARGFDDETLRKFNVRYVTHAAVLTKSGKKLNIRHSIAIPIYSEDGELLSWCYRATPASPEYQPRYFYTTGSNTRDILFAHHLAKDYTDICVTEGPIDSMWIWQAGYPSVAMFGAGNVLAPAKIGRLTDFRKVHIFGDRNKAGIQLANTVGSLIRTQTSVMICRYQKRWVGDDPNTLSLEQVRYAVERSIPYHVWIMQDQAKTKKGQPYD